MLEQIRRAAAAGRFYPRDPRELRDFVEERMAAADHPAKGRVRAAIAPHAGYVFSGDLAAEAVALTAPFDRAWVLGPSHYSALDGAALPPQEAFQTPLGKMPVDREAVDNLMAADRLFVCRAEPHGPEHSLEVLLPFIQVRNPAATVVPIACGGLDATDAERLGRILAEHWGPRDLLLVSSDFTHYGAHFNYRPFPASEAPEKLRELDGGAIDRIVARDPDGFLAYIRETGATICGRLPIAIFLHVLNAAAAPGSLELLRYDTSGARLNDYDSSVSYASIIYYE